MAKLGTKKRPVVARVRTVERAAWVMEFCDAYGWHCIVGVEPDKPEDISDVERLLNPPTVRRLNRPPGRNERCPCGSGRKYKRCCARPSATH